MAYKSNPAQDWWVTGYNPYGADIVLDIDTLTSSNFVMYIVCQKW